MSPIIYYIEINVICILVLGIIYISVASIKESRKAKIFGTMLFLSIIFCVTDLLAGVFRGATFTGARAFLYTINIIYIICPNIIAVLWVFYSMRIVYDRIIKWLAIFLSIVALAVVLLDISAPINSLAFYLDENNLYCRGSFIWINWIFGYPCNILPLFFIPFTKEERKSKMAIILFPIFPLLACLFQLFNYGISTAQVGITASLVMVYAMLQVNEIKRNVSTVKLYNEMMNTDSLTGVGNRRNYDTKLVEIQKRQWVGVAFCDINGLKETNDKYGHKAGDELIINFTNMLKAVFTTEDIYRISGDEFVIISNDKENFNTKVEELFDVKGDRAALGFVSGEGNAVLDLVRQSEELMYIEKDAYYTRTKKTRRK